MRKVYQLVRTAGPTGTECHVVVLPDGRPEMAYHLEHVVLHSPDGLEWGYSGSGPADTALSVLADLLNEHPTREQLAWGESRAGRYHQRVKFRFIGRLHRDLGSQDVDGDDILAYLAEHPELEVDRAGGGLSQSEPPTG